MSDHSVVLASLQNVPYECLGLQSQVWQPRPLAMFQVSDAQWSQCWPITFGRQWHWPLLWSQWQSPDDGQLEGSLPSWLQTHSVDKNQPSSGFIKILLQSLIQIPVKTTLTFYLDLDQGFNQGFIEVLSRFQADFILILNKVRLKFHQDQDFSRSLKIIKISIKMSSRL